MDENDYTIIRQLFDDYLRMYSSRDDRLTAHFSDNFSGFTGGGDFLVKNREKWVDITRQDFAQIKNPLRIELKDLAIQSLSETIAVTTGFFAIHLPIKDHILSRETARLVLIFRKETEGWKISHSSISIPYFLVREGEIYPMQELVDRNQFLEKLVAERTIQLSEANNNLQQTNENLSREIVDHKQTETALQNSLSLLAASLEATTDGILIVDRQGKIARWNQKFVEMWRIPLEILSSRDDKKVINHIMLQIVDPILFIDKVRKLYEQPAQSSFDQIEFLDGRIFERYSQPQRIQETIVGRVWSFHDITERKRAEEAIFNSNKLLQTVINTAPMRIFYKNKQLRYLGCNSAFAKDAGVACAEDLLGKDDYQLAWKEQAGLYQTDDLHVIESGISKLSYDEPQTTSGGSQVWLRTSKVPLRNEANEIIGVLGMYEDITDHKQVEIEKTRLLLRQRAILDNLPMMAWLKDTESRLEMINQPYADACGYTVEECIGKTDLDLFPEEMARGFIADDREVCKSGQKKHVEEAIATPDGIRWHLTYKTPVYDEQGLVIGTAGIAQDITERKQSEEEKVRLHDQLIQAQKMESVGQLAGGVAHEFNNMLGVILGHAEMAMDLVDPAQPLYVDLEEIRMAASRSAEITRQLLAFARKQSIAPKVLDLNETIEKLLKMLRRLIGENIDLLWMPVSGLWKIKADPSQIDQILTNLCVNARGAITGVGRITIETGNTTLDDNSCAIHADCVPGEYVRISVRDNGCGMDRATLAHVFEPFFTTKSVGQGTGLGLSMVYGAVKQNNGFVYVSSELGKGTNFTIYLPRYSGVEPTRWAARDERVALPAEGGRETILLVEDESTILKMITTMLQRLGYSVLAADTPGQAIRLVEGAATEIHLLMTDVIMPEMNGRALAERLISINSDMKCLFMSGYTSDIIAEQGVLVEGMHFIQKPFSQKELADRIQKVLHAEDGKKH